MSRKTLLGIAMLAYVVLHLVAGCVKDQRMPMPQSGYVPHTEERQLGRKAVLTIYDNANGARVGQLLVSEEPEIRKNDDGTWEVMLR